MQKHFYKELHKSLEKFKSLLTWLEFQMLGMQYLRKILKLKFIMFIETVYLQDGFSRMVEYLKNNRMCYIIDSGVEKTEWKKIEYKWNSSNSNENTLWNTEMKRIK